MRYGELFTPGTDVGSPGRPMVPAWAGRNAFRRAMDSGLLYAEGFACRPSGVTHYSAWCLDGETVVDPGAREPGTAYFGVALQPGYVRGAHEARRNDDDSDGFEYVFMGDHEEISSLDPSAAIVQGLGRDIPSWVRDWALNSEQHRGSAEPAPAWILDELLRFPDVRAARTSVRPIAPPAEERVPVEEQAPDPGPGQEDGDGEPSEGPLPMSYARYLIRRDDRLDSGMSLSCSGRTGSISSDNGVSLKQIKDGDSLDTLIRWADEHRPQCEWAVSPADEREHPELTVQKRAEVHLRWTTGFQANHDFAVLHRLDYNVWDAWLHFSRVEGYRVTEDPPVLLTRNGVSYELALAAVSRAMGEEMPDTFAAVYR
jgi:hypothetical protein